MAHLWDLFRNIDSDKQQRVLLKWEEHVANHRTAPPPSIAWSALQVIELISAQPRVERSGFSNA